MFIGHMGVALGTKKAAPGISLGTLLVASLLLDLMLSILRLAALVAARVDPRLAVLSPHSMLYRYISHGLLPAVGMAAVSWLVCFLFRRDFKAAAWICTLVLSHWILDALSHSTVPPMYPGGEGLVGMGLETSAAGTLVVEGILFALGAVLYLKATEPTDSLGTWGFWTFVIVLASLFLATEPDPALSTTHFVARLRLTSFRIWQHLRYYHLHAWVWISWGYWLDKHRRARLPKWQFAALVPHIAESSRTTLRHRSDP